MKRVLATFAIISLMFLGGCLSKRTEREMNQGTNSTTTGGAVEVVTGDYVFKNGVISSSLTAVNSSFMQFSYSSVDSLVTDPNDVNKILIKTASAEKTVPYLIVNAYEGEVSDISDKIKTNLNLIIPSGGVTEKNKGNIKLSAKTFEYTGGEIKKDDKTYYYLTAFIKENITVEGLTKVYTYLITSVTEGNKATDFVYFEDIIRSFKAGVPSSSVNLTYQSELIKKLKDLNDESKVYDYLSSSIQQSIYETINNFLVYVESAYKNEIIDDINLTKREETFKYLEQKKFRYINGNSATDENVWDTIAELYNNVYYAQISHLEGQVADAQGAYINAIAKSDVRPIGITNLVTLEKSLNDLISLKIKEDTQKGYNYDNDVIKEVVISELKNISSNKISNLFITAINYIVIAYLEDIRINGLGEGVYPNKPYQSLLTYEQKLLKVVTYKSYTYYTQEYFLEPNSNKNFSEGYRGNIHDYLMNKAVASLSSNLQDIGDSKTGSEDTDWATRKINYVFNLARKNILNEKIDNLNIALNNYFNKIETAKVREELGNLSLSEVRYTIKFALGDLTNSVRIYDAYDNLYSLILDENTATNKIGIYYLTSDKLVSVIKNISVSKAGVDYLGDTVDVTNGKSYIDLYYVADSKPYLTGTTRKDYRVNLAYEILSKNEKYIVP